MSDDLPDDAATDETSPINDTLQAPCLTVDQLLDILSDQRRRTLLEYFRQTSDETATLDTLIDEVLTRELDTSASPREQEDIATSIRHVHLPHLQEAGLLEYDERSGRVRYYQHPIVEQWLRDIAAWTND